MASYDRPQELVCDLADEHVVLLLPLDRRDVGRFWRVVLNWHIESFRSVGPIVFGESRTSVRKVLGSDFRTFKKDLGGNETDAYDSLGAHIYYDDSGLVEFVELFAPSDALFQGVSLVGRKVKDIVADLKKLGHEGEQDDVGYIFDELGIGLTVNGKIVEGVGAFKEGYYD